MDRLPPALIPLIAQFLPLRDKLLQWTHVSSSFHCLTPQCFHFDHLRINPSLVEHLSSSPSPPSISHVFSLSYREPSFNPTHRCLRAFFRLLHNCSFPHVDTLAFFNIMEEDHPAFFDDLFPPLSSPPFDDLFPHLLSPPFPLLSSLFVSFKESLFYGASRVHRGFFTPLVNVLTLRNLTLTNLEIDHSAFRLLLDLPLSHLDLSRSVLVPDQPGLGSLVNQSLREVQHRWKRLLLPLPVPVLDNELIDSTLRICKRNGEGEGEECSEGLHYLYSEGRQTVDTLHLISDISSLTVLHLTKHSSEADIPDLSPFVLSSGTTALPHLRHFISTRSGLPLITPQLWTPSHAQHITSAYQRFFTAYRCQLITLAITIPLHVFTSSALQVHAALSCSGLRKLSISTFTYKMEEGEERPQSEFSSALPQLVPLPALHTLVLHQLDISDAVLTAIVLASPNLRDLRLHTCPLISLDVLCSIRYHSAHLRRFRLEGAREDLFHRPFVITDTSSLPSFPSLSTLVIVTLPTPSSSSESSPANFPTLIDLLSLSPLSYLHLSINLRLPQLLSLSHFPLLGMKIGRSVAVYKTYEDIFQAPESEGERDEGRGIRRMFSKRLIGVEEEEGEREEESMEFLRKYFPHHLFRSEQLRTEFFRRLQVNLIAPSASPSSVK